MADVRVIGIRGNIGFSQADEHFAMLCSDFVLLDPAKVCGADHIKSAVLHAEKAFKEGRNRSKRLATETILYAAGERQIRRALDAMKPKDDGTMVVAIIDYDGDLHLDKLGVVQDDSLMEPSVEKALSLGAEMFEGVFPEDAVLEHVASVDLLKQ